MVLPCILLVLCSFIMICCWQSFVSTERWTEDYGGKGPFHSELDG